MAADAARLLGAVAEALNACERAGITIDSPVDAVMTSHGYVIAAGDPRLGSRWVERTRLAAPFTPPGAVPAGGPVEALAPRFLAPPQ